ncbi:MAG: hypothetical protein QOJ54_422 [Aliidongia sp.]|jgi:hypothetical protein|nr:hypothetical protein [Aliidongia sp.]
MRLVLAAAIVLAASAAPAGAQVAPTPACITYVAGLYDLPIAALDGLRAVEGGRVGQVTRNRNGTVDIGPFQVNSSWLPYFRRAWHRSSDAETEGLLRDDGCANALAAGIIFRMAVDQAHGDIGAAVGFYNAPHSPALAAAYRRRFIASVRQVLRPSE